MQLSIANANSVEDFPRCTSPVPEADKYHPEAPDDDASIRPGTGNDAATRLMHAVLDALPTPVFFKDRSGTYLGCNLAFARTLGKTPEELRGRTVFELWPPELAATYAAADEALLASGGEQHYEGTIALPDGEQRNVLFYKAVIRDAQGEVTGLVGTLLDITERKVLEQRLTALSRHDDLTGLLNRRAITEHMGKLDAERHRAALSPSVLLCDIDNFKRINDRYGHAAGDEVLRAIAGTLRAHVRDDDLIGRIGGEEFLIVLDNTAFDVALTLAERLRKSVAAARIAAEGERIHVTLSIGVAMARPLETTEDLIKRADACLYAAKRAGRNCVTGI
jgi:diguanylate cyclase (GGDEF)-like protein/PAS domain S-box-containing protein